MRGLAALLLAFLLGTPLLAFARADSPPCYVPIAELADTPGLAGLEAAPPLGSLDWTKVEAVAWFGGTLEEADIVLVRNACSPVICEQLGHHQVIIGRLGGGPWRLMGETFFEDISFVPDVITFVDGVGQVFMYLRGVQNDLIAILTYDLRFVFAALDVGSLGDAWSCNDPRD